MTLSLATSVARASGPVAPEEQAAAGAKITTEGGVIIDTEAGTDISTEV